MCVCVRVSERERGREARNLNATGEHFGELLVRAHPDDRHHDRPCPRGLEFNESGYDFLDQVMNQVMMHHEVTSLPLSLSHTHTPMIAITIDPAPERESVCEEERARERHRDR